MIQVSKNQISTLGQKKSVMSNTVISHLFFLWIKILFFRDFFLLQKKNEIFVSVLGGPNDYSFGQGRHFYFLMNRYLDLVH